MKPPELPPEDAARNPDSKDGMTISAIVAAMSAVGVLWSDGLTSFLLLACCLGSIWMLYRSAMKRCG